MESKLTVYGAYWCPDCRRSKKFLGENFIPFNWVDIEEDKEGRRICYCQEWRQTNHTDHCF